MCVMEGRLSVDDRRMEGGLESTSTLLLLGECCEEGEPFARFSPSGSEDDVGDTASSVRGVLGRPLVRAVVAY